MIFFLPMLLAGCAGLGRAGGEQTQTVETYPYVSPTPLPECGQTTQVGVSVDPINDHEATFYITGLVPGEHVQLAYKPVPVPDEGTIMIEAWPARPADENGSLQWVEGLLHANQQPNTWLVRVIHHNGVACLEFTLPNE